MPSASKKFTLAVLPGCDETFARALRPSSLLRSDDLPTLERPTKATSGVVGAGSPFTVPYEAMKRAFCRLSAMGGVLFSRCLWVSILPEAAGAAAILGCGFLAFQVEGPPDSLRSESPRPRLRARGAAVLPNYARLSLALWSPGALSVSPSAVRNSTFGKVPSRKVTSGGSGKTARRAESQLDQVGHRFPRKDPISAEHYATEKNA